MKPEKNGNELLEIIPGIIFFTLFFILFNVFYDRISFLSSDFDAIKPLYNLSLISGILFLAGRLIIRSEGYKLFVEFSETVFFVVLGIIFWIVFPFNTSVFGNVDLWNFIFRVLIVVPPAITLVGFLTKIFKREGRE